MNDMNPKQLPATFQRNLKWWRLHRDLSVRQLAVQLGASPASIVNWESGKMSPTLDTVVKLAETLKVTPEALLSDFDGSVSHLEGQEILQPTG